MPNWLAAILDLCGKKLPKVARVAAKLTRASVPDVIPLRLQHSILYKEISKKTIIMSSSVIHIYNTQVLCNPSMKRVFVWFQLFNPTLRLKVKVNWSLFNRLYIQIMSEYGDSSLNHWRVIVWPSSSLQKKKKDSLSLKWIRSR